MKTDLRYSPAAYETFPLPSIFSSRLEEIGGAYLKRRSEILKTRNIGLTKLCNLLHLKSEVSADISELRALQARMDQEVINCYGFNGLVVEMGFYESAKGERFGILQRHQEKILANLLALNHIRHKEEVAAGFHADTEKSNAPNATKRKTRSSKASALHQQAGLDFGLSAVNPEKSVPTLTKDNQWGEKSSDQILAWLEAHTGWFTRQAILAGCGAATDDWDAAIAELLRDEFIETHADGNRWRAKP